MAKRYFAVGVTKEWVEVIQGVKAPTRHTSTAEKDIIINESHYDYYTDNYKWTKKPGKIIIKATNFIGGTVVATLSSSDFRKMSRVVIKKGGMIELTPTIIKKLNLEA